MARHFLADDSFKLAHLSGDAALAYVRTAGAEGGEPVEHFVSGGADSLLLLREAEALEPVGSERGVGVHDSEVTAVAAAACGGLFASACQDGSVRLFDHPSGELRSLPARCTLPVRALALSDDGKLLAVGGEDEGVLLVDLTQPAEPELRHTLAAPGARAVRSLALQPKGALLAVCYEDGAVVLWDCASGAAAADLGKLAPSSQHKPDWHPYTRLAWSPDGGRLFVPGRNNDVVALSAAAEGAAWVEAARLKEGHLGDVSLLAVSPNGLYLASAGMDAQACVWDLRSGALLASAKLPDVATGLAWRGAPGANALAVMTYEGSMALWDRPVPARAPPPATPLEELDLSQFGDGAKAAYVDDSAVEGGAEEAEEEAEAEEAEEEEEESGGGAPSKGGPRRRPAVRERIVTVAAPPPPEPEAQGALQPGATGYAAGGALPRRRFLAYNLLGSLTARDDGAGSQHLEVHFHDSERGGARVAPTTDYLGVTLGGLGPAGCAFAAPSRPAADAPASLSFRPFDAWGGPAGADWRLALGGGEEPLCLAVGGAFLALATSSRLLRLFSPAGVQLAVLALEGAPVALAAHGQLLAAVHQAGPPSGAPPSEQRLAYSLLDVGLGQRLGGGPLPLSERAQLAWLGFSEEGLLAAADSAGRLRLRASGTFGGAWVPVWSSAAARSGEAERHWVVGLGGAELYAVVTKAAEAEPQPQHRPLLSVFPLAVPVLAEGGGGAAAEAGALEEAALRGRLWAAEGEAGRLPGGAAAAAEAATGLNKALIKLFHAALKGERHARAAELAEAMTHGPCLAGALALANSFRAAALAERISHLIAARQALEMHLAGEAAAAEYSLAPAGWAAPAATPSPAAPPAVGGNKFARKPAAPAPAPAAAAAAAAEENAEPGAAEAARKRPAPAGADAQPPKRPVAANPFARR